MGSIPGPGKTLKVIVVPACMAFRSHTTNVAPSGGVIYLSVPR